MQRIKLFNYINPNTVRIYLHPVNTTLEYQPTYHLRNLHIRPTPTKKTKPNLIHPVKLSKIHPQTELSAKTHTYITHTL